MLPLAVIAPVVGQIASNTAGTVIGAGAKALASAFSPAARAQHKLAVKAARDLRRNSFGYSDPQRTALLRGGQRQAQALQAEGQAGIAMQQAAQGGPVQGGYAAAQGQVARAAQDTVAQQRQEVNAASDRLAASQREEAMRLVGARADQVRENAQAFATDVIAPVAQEAVQQGRDFKRGEGAFDPDLDGLESWAGEKYTPKKKVL